MAMTLRLPDGDNELLRAYAAAQGRSMHEVVVDAVREHIATHSLDALVDDALDRVLAAHGGTLKRLGEA